MFSLKNFLKLCSVECMPLFEKHGKKIEVKAKQFIFSEGEIVQGVFFVEKGYVKVLSKFGDKEQSIVRLAGNGMFLGHRGINANVYPVSAVALVNTDLRYIPIDVFMEIIKGNSELAIALIHFLCDELRETEERMKNLLLPDPRQKVASLLVKSIDSFGFCKEKPKKIAYSITRGDLANMAGLTYETIIRTLSSFEKNNIIALIGKEYEIHNVKKLKQIAQGEISLN